MPVKTEPVHAGEFLVSEGNNRVSRECVTLAKNLTLLPGTVLSKNTSTAVYGPLDLSATNGREQAVGVLWDHVVTGASGEKAVIIARLAELHQDLLIWPDSITDEQKTTAIKQLAQLHIVLRQGEHS